MSSTYTVFKSPGIAGVPDLPGDKSIAHRSAIFAAIGRGESIVANYPESADPQTTLAALRQLGVQMHTDDAGIHIVGSGIKGFTAPKEPIDCGNSGTTMRLLAGVLAGCDFDSVLTGDESLSRRPMKRIADPLTEMGARITLTEGFPPIHISGSRLRPITYKLPVASAQVKSCVLLAGLSIEEETTVVEVIPSRDHTERMLGLDSVQLGDARAISCSSANIPDGRTWVIPKDFSAAAFFLVGGMIVPESKLVLEGVGMNPSRTGLMSVMRAMGGSMTIVSERSFSAEPIADIGVETSVLHGIQIPEDLVPNLIDEIPILAVAATQAEGKTIVRGARELRYKECDRIDAIVINLRAMGADITEFEDGFEISGPTTLKGTTVDSFGDHRIAMGMAIAGLVASGETTIVDSDCAAVSFPGFFDQIERLSAFA